MNRLSRLLCVVMVFGLVIPAVASINVMQTDLLEPSIPGSNDFKSELNSLGFDSILEGDLQITQNGFIQFFFHGAESGFANSFEVDGISVFTEANQAWNAAGTLIHTIAVSAGDTLGTGFLDRLAFTTTGGGGLNANLGEAGFGIFASTPGSFGPVVPDSRTYFGYDDNGAGPDDNHDDMIISAFFIPAAVPEPGSLAIVAGLLGLFAITRNRRQ